MFAVIVNDKGQFEANISDTLTDLMIGNKIKGGLKQFKEQGYVSLNAYLRKNKRDLKEESKILEKLNIKRLYIFVESSMSDSSLNIDEKKKKKKKSQFPWDENPWIVDIENYIKFGKEFNQICRRCKNECKILLNEKKIGICKDYEVILNSYTSVYRRACGKNTQHELDKVISNGRKYLNLVRKAIDGELNETFLDNS